MPEHNCYCEVFAGGASVFWQKQPSKTEVLNDIHKDLINLYRVVQYHPEEFIKNFQWLLRSREEFYRQLSLPPHALTDIQRAVRTLYIIKNCFGGRYLNPGFGCTTDCRKIFSVRSIEELLLACHQRLEGVTLECLDYKECIARYDRPDTLFYLDPPYYGCEGYYGNDWQRDDFKKLAEILRGIKGKFLLSINDTPETREIFKEFTVIQVKTRYSAAKEGNKQVRELVYKNF